MSRSKTDKYYETYDYNSRRPVFVELETLREDQQKRLMESKTFCMIPWTHIHGFPTGEAYPCCLVSFAFLHWLSLFHFQMFFNCFGFTSERVPKTCGKLRK